MGEDQSITDVDFSDYDWPSPYFDQEAPREFMHAIGTIVAAWNIAERYFEDTLCAMIDGDWRIRYRIMDMLGNRSRVDLMKGFIKEYEMPSELSQGLLHAARIFEACLDNRNLIVHSLLYPEPGEHFLVSSKTHPEFKDRYIQFDIAIFNEVIADMKALQSLLFDFNDMLTSKVPVPFPVLPPIPRRLAEIFPAALVERARHAEGDA